MAAPLPIRIALAMLVCVWGATACSSTASNRYRNVELNLQSAVQTSALGPQDVIDVRVYRHKDLTGTFEISPTGEIDFPLIGKVTAEGLVASELASLIKRRLADGFIRDPHVNVQVKAFNSKKIFVLGNVKKPGRFPFVQNMTVVEAITVAGGFGGLAEKNYTIVTRAGRRIPIPVEKIMQGLATNFRLQPGDIVYIPETIL